MMLRRVDTPGSAIGIDAAPPHLVVADWNQVMLFRLDDPARPTRVARQLPYSNGIPKQSGRVLDVAIRDNTIFMAEWAQIQAHQIVPDAQSADILTSAQVELPRTAAGATGRGTVAVENLGERELEIVVVSIDPPFTATVSDHRVAPGSGALISLTVTPTSDDVVRGLLTVLSNDPDEPEMLIPVRANLPGLRTGDVVPSGIAFTELDTGIERRLDDQRGSVVLLAYFATF